MHSLSPEWLRVDSRRTCTHWPFSCLYEAVQASPSHRGRSGHPSSEASCLGPHSPCAAELEFEYKPRSLHCTHGLELRMRGDNLAGGSMCPAPSAGPAWGDPWGLLMALVVGRSCTETSPCSGLGEAPIPRRQVLTCGRPQKGWKQRAHTAAPGQTWVQVDPVWAARREWEIAQTRHLLSLEI